MPFREFRKNSREAVRVAPSKYEGIDRIDIRIFVRNHEDEIFPTRKGISLNIDQIPDLINCLEWSLQQPCSDDPDAAEVVLMETEDSDKLALAAHRVLSQHGLPVHWDTAEKMVLMDPSAKGFNRWQLHYVLATRKDLFAQAEQGCFRVKP